MEKKSIHNLEFGKIQKTPNLFYYQLVATSFCLLSIYYISDRSTIWFIKFLNILDR